MEEKTFIVLDKGSKKGLQWYCIVFYFEKKKITAA